MEETTEPQVVTPAVSPNGSGNLLDTIKQTRKELEPFGKTTTLEVQGYKGFLAVRYQYIGSEVTEEISRKVINETKNVNGLGMALLSSIDTLVAACNEVVTRESSDKEWRSLLPGKSFKLDPDLASLLDFEADDERETVLGLFGSEHAILQTNVALSRWLTDVTRDMDTDFLGL